jgi:hypothetical protein
MAAVGSEGVRREIALLACGSYNPPTNMHLRMFGAPCCLARFATRTLAHSHATRGRPGPHPQHGIRPSAARPSLTDTRRIRKGGASGGAACAGIGCLTGLTGRAAGQGLLAASHRLAMCRAAVAGSSWITVSEWETQQSGWSRTVLTLRAHRAALEESRDALGATATAELNVRLLCGSDLLDSMVKPDVWLPEDVRGLRAERGDVLMSGSWGAD